jgi:hypothetical protein
MAFAARMAEIRLAGLKAIEPQAPGVLRHPEREAEASVRHWRPHRRHIQLVGQDIKGSRPSLTAARSGPSPCSAASKSERDCLIFLQPCQIATAYDETFSIRRVDQLR